MPLMIAAQRRVRTGVATDRLRAGLTGLGTVVVVLLLTAANTSRSPATADALPQGDTLAVIGVAPGSEQRVAPDAGSGPAAPAQPRP